MISSTIKTYLKTYLKRKEDKDKNDEEEKRLKFFESLNDTTDFLLLNSEQWTGEWLLLSKWFGTFFKCNSLSKWLFSWISVRWVLRLPDSENDLEHSLQGRGRRGVFFTNGFSSKMASPQKITSPQESVCELCNKTFSTNRRLKHIGRSHKALKLN